MLYQAKITIGDYVETRSFEVLADPREEATQKDYDEKTELLGKIGGAVKSLYESVREMKDVEYQLKSFDKKLGEGEEANDELKEEMKTTNKNALLWFLPCRLSNVCPSKTKFQSIFKGKPTDREFTHDCITFSH